MKTTNQAVLLLPSQILEQARELLAKPDGWVQGKYGGPAQKSFCAIGAINYVTSGRETPNWKGYGRTDEERKYGNRAVKILSDVMLEDSDRWSIPSWNDKLGRTVEEVLAAFSKAIKKAKAGGE